MYYIGFQDHKEYYSEEDSGFKTICIAAFLLNDGIRKF
jgi:hypothetical protein